MNNIDKEFVKYVLSQVCEGYIELSVIIAKWSYPLTAGEEEITPIDLELILALFESLTQLKQKIVDLTD